MRLWIVGLSSLALLACSGEPAAPPAVDPGAQPAGWRDELALNAPVDLNPDPDVLEIELTAHPAEVELLEGTATTIWSYSGGLPGPLIRAKVGDRLIVHFENALPEPTTIHWHGLRVPAAMDGAPGHSQPPIEPGETFRYEFVLPDAGTFWYHPHVNSAKQVGDGLYGALIVEDPEEPTFGDEVVLVLSDIGIQDDGSLMPQDSGGELGTLFGREGNVLLVNGQRDPTLLARPGKPQRWRVVNSAKSRYFQLVIDGHAFTRVGGDGGLIEHPITSDALVLVPGERADVVVVPQGEPGQELEVRWVPYDRGFGSTFNRPEERAFGIRLEGEPVVTPELPAPARRIEATDISGATPVEVHLTRQEGGAKTELGINGIPHWEAEPLTGHVGEVQLWSVINDTEWAHPFHLHGFFFQVLGDDDLPLWPREWKDTVDVPVGKAVRLAVHYDDRPGMWMFHCHILDHADAGMMGMLMVEGSHDHDHE